jgi:hypothetical protein
MLIRRLGPHFTLCLTLLAVSDPKFLRSGQNYTQPIQKRRKEKKEIQVGVKYLTRPPSGESC